MTDDRHEAAQRPDDWNDALDGPWTDEMGSAQAIAEGEDIELIVEYLNKHLDPERTEQVRQRLDDDPAFRELAAPLLLTWQIPSHLERHPRPVGELERAWDDFTRRAGFAHQQRKARRRRLGLLALLIAGLGLLGFTLRAPVVDWYVTRRDYVVVPPSADWIPLGDSVFVQLAPDATLRAQRTPVGDVRHLLLRGRATFRLLALDSATAEPRRNGIVVHTRGGVVTAGESEFSVAARGDTTLVAVQRPTTRRFMYFVPLPTALFVRRDTTSDPIVLKELEQARLVRGRAPERLSNSPALPE